MQNSLQHRLCIRWSKFLPRLLECLSAPVVLGNRSHCISDPGPRDGVWAVGVEPQFGRPCPGKGNVRLVSRDFSGSGSPLLFPVGNHVLFHTAGGLHNHHPHNDSRFCLRPFRKVNEKGVLLWDKIYKLQKGQIYKQVPHDQFIPSAALLRVVSNDDSSPRLTRGWQGSVLCPVDCL